MTGFGDNEKNKVPNNDRKKKRTTKEKKFLLTIPGKMLFGNKKRATRKLWHIDDNRPGICCLTRRVRLLGKENGNEQQQNATHET